MATMINMYWNYAKPVTIFQTALTKESEMAYVIALPCIGVKDTACVAICPCDCIHPKKDEAGFETAEMLYIDPRSCIDCNLCMDECPVHAIFPQDDLPAEWQHFIEKNAAHFAK
jgi:NAD-dependent dihydropyrimidine dehydrogenase PreA subunit